MGRLYHKKINLLDAPKDSWIITTANTKSKYWPGLLANIKSEFPESFKQFMVHCDCFDEALICPTIVCSPENGKRLVFLLTSDGFNKKDNTKYKVFKNLANSIEDLFSMYEVPKEIYSDNLCGEIFKLQPEGVEELLLSFMDKYDVIWNMCDEK
jgi:hypothetical protein